MWKMRVQFAKYGKCPASLLLNDRRKELIER